MNSGIKMIYVTLNLCTYWWDRIKLKKEFVRPNLTMFPYKRIA